MNKKKPNQIRKRRGFSASDEEWSRYMNSAHVKRMNISAYIRMCEAFYQEYKQLTKQTNERQS